MEFIAENYEWLIPAGAILLDHVLGALPDKYSKYPGVFLSIANTLYNYGKRNKR